MHHTLGMLLRMHAADATGPASSLAQTYRAAVSDMLEGSRIAVTAGVDAPALARRLLGQLAVVCMLSNKMALWTGVARDGAPPDAVAVTEVAGIGIGLDDPLRPSDEVFVRAVIASGFFLPDGPNRWAWPHQSFAEFLAADCLAQAQLDRDRILDLLSVRQPGGSRIAPQLREVAAWLAGIDATARRALVGREPVLLLRSDVAAADDAFKAALVSELLARSEAGDLGDFTLDRRVRLGQLRHPGLAITLVPWVDDKRLRLETRRIAIEIARSCGLEAVGPSLLRLATDADEPLHLRATATIAAGELLTEAGDLARLRPLLDSGPDSDPQDELRGAALWAL